MLELRGNRWCKALKTEGRRQEGLGRGRAHEASEITVARGTQGPGRTGPGQAGSPVEKYVSLKSDGTGR